MLDTVQIVVAVVGTLAVLYGLHLARQLAEILLFAAVMILGGVAWEWLGGSWGVVVGVMGIVPGGILLVLALWRIRRVQPAPSKGQKTPDDEE